MARRLSRRRVTDYVAAELLAGRGEVISQLAAYLIETRQTRSLELFVRDIEAVMAEKGHVVADVLSAFALADKTRQEMTRFIKEETGASEVQFREEIDPAVLGGFRLRIPGRERDATLARHLTVLRTRFKKA